jgi:hypothetical protein
MKCSLKSSMLFVVMGLMSFSAHSGRVVNGPIKDLKMPVTLKIENPILFNLDSAKNFSDPSKSTLVFYNGKLLGNSSLYIPESGVITKDAVTEVLSRLVKKPAAGFYCFINLKPTKELQFQGNSAILDASEMRLKSCSQNNTVSKIEGNTVSSFSWNAFGKSNEISIHYCSAESVHPEEDSGIYGEIGCISYLSNKVPSVSDFLTSLNVKSSELFIGDSRSDEEIAEAQRKDLEVQKKAAEIRREEERKRAEESKKAEIIFEDYKAKLDEDEKFMQTMPKVNSAKFIALSKNIPDFKEVHSDCIVGRVLKQPGFQDKCDKFFEYWNNN